MEVKEQEVEGGPVDDEQAKTKAANERSESDKAKVDRPKEAYDDEEDDDDDDEEEEEEEEDLDYYYYSFADEVANDATGLNPDGKMNNNEDPEYFAFECLSPKDAEKFLQV